MISHRLWLAFIPFFFGCRSESLPEAHYVGREVCAGCHAAEVRAWTGSDHDLAMSEAVPESVLGDFSGVAFEECGVRTRFFRRAGDFLIETVGPAGTVDTFRVSHTFGFDPLQQYLVPIDGGRLQAFTIAWDSRQKRWFSLYPDDCVAPGEWLHWSGDAMNWNYMCADCHSTNVQRNFDVAADTYRTSFSEVDVSCEACHGPGERHVALAESREYGDDTGLTVRLERADPTMAGLASRPPNRAEVETCAPCHSRRRMVYPGYHPGKPFLDHFEPELLREDLYFADGKIKDEVYEYGSFVQSRMYAKGVRCSDCHDPHSTGLRLSGNPLCLKCHDASYEAAGHVRHRDGSVSCVDCHMPERTYMLVDARRDHSFSVPRPGPDSSGACNACHAGRTIDASWYANVSGTHPFADAFAAGRRGEAEAEPELIRIAGSREAPEIVRATALTLLERYPTVRASKAAVAALADSTPLVRVEAVRALEDSPEAAGKIEPLLTDTVRLVRMEAARVLSHLAAGRLLSEEHETALGEYRTGQEALNDQAAAHFNLAVLLDRRRVWEEAEREYLTALRIDSTFVPARMNLAMSYNDRRQTAGEEEAVRLYSAARAELETSVRIEPRNAEASYMLGLLLAESEELLPRAAELLTRASDLDSTDARAAYNAGLARQRLGNSAEAERLLLRAYRLEPEQIDYLNALSIFYGQQERWREAVRFTDSLLVRLPQNPEFIQRRRFLEEHL